MYMQERQDKRAVCSYPTFGLSKRNLEMSTTTKQTTATTWLVFFFLLSTRKTRAVYLYTCLFIDKLDIFFCETALV